MSYGSFRSESHWERKLPKPLYWILFITFLVIVVSIGIGSCLITNELSNASESVLEMYDWQDNLHDNNVSVEVSNENNQQE